MISQPIHLQPEHIMTWFSAITIGIVADLIVGICLALFVHADKRYQAEKLAWLRAEGLYRPESDQQP